MGVVKVLWVQFEVVTVEIRVELGRAGITSRASTDEPDQVVQRVAAQRVSPVDERRHRPGGRVNIDLAIAEVGMNHRGGSCIEEWCEVITQQTGTLDELFRDDTAAGQGIQRPVDDVRLPYRPGLEDGVVSRRCDGPESRQFDAMQSGVALGKIVESTNNSAGSPANILKGLTGGSLSDHPPAAG